MKWIMVIAGLVLALWGIGLLPVAGQANKEPDQKLIELSGKLLLQVKMDQSVDSLREALAKIETDTLISGLSNDEARKTFWINIYNAYFQILATKEKKTRPAIFKEKLITIGGLRLSLDQIEHGILRRYRSKLSLGYLPQFFPGKIIKQLAVSKIDYRIHFALNCGATSCPPIAFYNYGKIDKQLDIAASSFLKTDTEVDSLKKQVTVSRILQWFKADFGGNKGIKLILKQYMNQDFSDYSLEFKEYDWTQKMKNFDS
ncbi:DUF547 domain-containing protein [Dyadobacter fanqingshengii]|uniref:DUF547 domain-containing protein n=1 Tax=Dyadobacter fanqingshengii TaxID=2906443 RepID=A0A9X1PAM7_9BACT|nr:DUF547 domain-containing protein [Dyadobacter fanqingshengii]MCF0040423.1 DUF547 domain-containing protein [Dyadobacter fanqingshengii]USJ37835.1 DUF547 domain-containing protein [Dyadobacter fanqingshengii]